MKHFYFILINLVMLFSASAEITGNLIPEQIVSHSIALVKVDAVAGNETIRASGFVWPDKNHVVTAFHVIASSGNISVSFDDGANWTVATVEKTLRSRDLAELRIEDVDTLIKPISVANEQSSAHSEVIAIGYPPGVATRHFFHGTVEAQGPGLAAETLGELLSPGKIRDKLNQLGFPSFDKKILLVQAPLQPGMSGGPVVNNDGQLVGIINGGLEKGFGEITWAIPSDALTELSQMNLVEAVDDIQLLTTLFGAELNAANALGKNIGPFMLTKLRTRTLSQLTQLNDDPQGLLQAATSLAQQNANIQSSDNSTDDNNAESPLNWQFDLYRIDFTNAPAGSPAAIIAVPIGITLTKGAGPNDVIANTSDQDLLWKARVLHIRNVADITRLALNFENNLEQRSAFCSWYVDPAWSYPSARFWPSGFSIQRRDLGGYQGVFNIPGVIPPGFPSTYISVVHSSYHNMLISIGTISLKHDVLAIATLPGRGSAELKEKHAYWSKFVLATLMCGFNDALAMEGQSSETANQPAW
jgi:hypothetical protein